MLRTNYVSTVFDIEENIAWLEAFYQNSDEEGLDEYRILLARGHQYYCCVVGDQVVFGPSRMIGYRGNTFSKRHELGMGDGGRTSQVISRILGRIYISDLKVEAEFQAFCQDRGIAPHNQDRTYWVTSEASFRLGERKAEHDLLSNETVDETTRTQLIASRIGQGRFRADLMSRWNSRCPVTMCSMSQLSRASHIKPWAVSDNRERLDPDSGLLLAVHVDALFDSGLITFDDDGEMRISRSMSETELAHLGISIENARIVLKEGNLAYLKYHRECIFRD